MIHAATQDEHLTIRSMNKALRVIAIADNDEEANAYMEKHDRAAVIACFGPFVFLADQYDGGSQ